MNGTATDFILDNSMFVQERNHATGTSIATYLVGARGPEYRRDDATGQIRWYLYDGLGSVLGEIDPNGNITSSRKYDVYGLVRGGTNPGGTGSHKFVGQLGHPSEDNTGLIYMRARYYDPAVGRFVTEDPAMDGENWYVYAANNPVNSLDSSGKFVLQLALVGLLVWILNLVLGENAKAFCKELFGDYQHMKALARWIKRICKIGSTSGSAEIVEGAGDKVLAPVDDSEVGEATGDLKIEGGMTKKIESAAASEAVDILIEIISEEEEWL